MVDRESSFDPARRTIAAGVFICTFILYALTCAPGVVWQDGATFQHRIWHGELHSPLGLALAHPLYIVLAKAFSFLPLGSFAHRVNLFSAFCAAACLKVLVDLLLTVTRSRGAAICGVALLAVSHTFWKHAVMAEVMTLYALGLACELWLVEKFLSRGKAGWLVAALFVNGLNTSNHLLATLHLPAYAGLVLWAATNRRISWNTIGKAAVCYVLGLGLYLTLIIQELAHGRAFFEVIHSALFGEGFAKDVLNTSLSVVKQSVRTAEYFALNFPTPLIVLAPIGFVLALSNWAQRGFAAFAGGIFVVAFIFAFRYPVADQYVFFLPCYVLITIFVALCLANISKMRGGRLWAGMVAALLPALVFEVGPVMVKKYNVTVPFRQDIAYRDSVAYFLRPRMNGEDSAERFARDALNATAPDGLLIADISLNNVLAYVRDVEGVRPDVALSLPCDVVPDAPNEPLTPERVEPYMAQRSVFTVTGPNSYLPAWLFEQYEMRPGGPIFRLVKRGQ